MCAAIWSLLVTKKELLVKNKKYVLPMCAAIWSVRLVVIYRPVVQVQRQLHLQCCPSYLCCHLEHQVCAKTLDWRLICTPYMYALHVRLIRSNKQCFAFNIQVLVRFWVNHHLLDLVERPQWRVVKNRSRSYVEKVSWYLNAEILV